MTLNPRLPLTCYAPALLLVVAGCQPSSDLGPVASASASQEIRKTLVGGEEGEADGGSAEPEGTGWATLKGRFTYVGDPPTMPPYNVTSDQATCTAGGVAPKQQTLIVGQDGGLANVAIFLRKASRVNDSAKPPEEPFVLDQKECEFLSHVFPVVIGQPVTIKNSDPVGHNTKISGKNGFNRTIPAGESVPYDPRKEEAMPAAVACSIHPWMSAYILPRENGYMAITKADGAFEIPNLPAGEELEFQVWHESAVGSNQGLVVLTDAADELGWSKKGRFTIKLNENETKEIEIAVPADAFSIGG